jgi:hypothetical protein
MNYLTNYYKNLSEELQTKINFLKHELNELTTSFSPEIYSDSQSSSDPRNPDVSTPVKNKNRRLQKTGKKITEDLAHSAKHNDEELKDAVISSRKDDEEEYLKFQIQNLLKQFNNMKPNENSRYTGKNSGIMPEFSRVYDYLQSYPNSHNSTWESPLYANMKKIGTQAERQEF